jgi:hypothetical protein
MGGVEVYGNAKADGCAATDEDGGTKGTLKITQTVEI